MLWYKVCAVWLYYKTCCGNFLTGFPCVYWLVTSEKWGKLKPCLKTELSPTFTISFVGCSLIVCVKQGNWIHYIPHRALRRLFSVFFDTWLLCDLYLTIAFGFPPQRKFNICSWETFNREIMLWYQLKGKGEQMAVCNNVGIKKLSGIPL